LPNIEFNIDILNSSANTKSLLAKEFIKLMLCCAGKAFDAIEYELRSSDMTAYIKEVKNAALNVNEERF
jgi:hypothetical protein